ncbi:sulfotransferase [Hyphomicrobiales bacterium]|nr:sulfotransferase [Hyphomicrobiales bacterium]
MSDVSSITIFLEPDDQLLRELDALMKLDDILVLKEKSLFLKSLFPKSVKLNKYLNFLKINNNITIEPPEEVIQKYNMFFINKDYNLIQRKLDIDIALYPNSSKLLTLLGSLYYHLGKFNLAFNNFQSAIILDPRNLDALHNLTNIYINNGDLENALNFNRKCLDLDPHNIMSNFNHALILKNMGSYDSSIKILQNILISDSKNYHILNMLGIVFYLQKNYLKSINIFEKSLNINSDIFDTYFNIANSYLAINNITAAIDNFKSCLKIFPEHLSSLINISSALQGIGDYDGALDHLNKAVVIKPSLQSSLNLNFANIYRDLGKFNKASELYNLILADNKFNFHSYLSLSDISTSHSNYLTTDSNTFINMIDIFNNKLKPPNHDFVFSKDNLKSDNILISEHLGFPIYKSYSREGKHNKAFKYLVAANKAVRSNLNYDIRNTKNSFFNVLNGYKDFNGPKIKDNKFKTRPIFIIGMPRSGSTLVEQILSSHSNVFGAGELYQLSYSAEAYNFSNNPGNLSLDELDSISSDYLRSIDKMNYNDKNFITDKMPSNFYYTGLIDQIFPDSIIINTLRDPLDTCFSIFETHFSSVPPYSYDLEEIAIYYNIYKKCLDYWNDVLGPNRIYNVVYEDLISNTSTEINKLLQACDLEFEESCLKFYENDRPIRTASVSQARNKIYNSSLKKWKFHENEIQSLIENLDSGFIP